VAVHHQDPNLPQLLAIKDGTERGRGLLIVDRLATAWGVHPDGAGGKTVWCTLKLPASDPAVQEAQTPDASVAEPLTTRELAVLELLATHLSTPEIGRQLYVSVNTIRTQVRAIYRKLQVNRRGHAVARARQLGLLPQPQGSGTSPTPYPARRPNPWPRSS
jgi:LuxR family maltose regulon positive regulatory protein